MKKNQKSKLLKVFCVEPCVSSRNIIAVFDQHLKDEININEIKFTDDKLNLYSMQFKVFDNNKWKTVTTECIYLYMVNKKFIRRYFKQSLDYTRGLYGTIKQLKITIKLIRTENKLAKKD